METWVHENFLISTEKEKLNFEIIHHYLSTSYWAKERSREQIIESIQHSLCFGVYHQNAQVGFARVITDYSTFAYLADVFILPAHQKNGLGKWLIDTIFSMERLKKIAKWLLLTNDAQKLYARVGFEQFPYPERVMIKNAST